MRWLLLLFIVGPLVELYLLLLIGSHIGLWPTIGILLVAGVLGAVLAKHEGLRVLANYRQALAEGRMPDEGILAGLLVLLGGVLLILPGVLSDVAGLLLLVPPTRRLIAFQVQKSIAKKIDAGMMQVMTVRGPAHEEEADDPLGFGNVFVQRGEDPLDRGAGVEVVDTEGVEVQSTHLLGPAPRKEEDPD